MMEVFRRLQVPRKIGYDIHFLVLDDALFLV